MSYLITGASGFIGHALTQSLLQKGETVYTVRRSPQPARHINEIPLTADLACAQWTNSLSDPVDVVVHLVQSKRYREFPAGAQDMVRVNLDATFELLEWARQNHVKKFLFASTGNVYQPSKQLLQEGDRCHPTSMYAATKLSGEYLVQQYAGHLDTTIVRFFGVYGPHQREMIVPNMIERVRGGKEVALAQGAGLYFTPIYLTDCLAMLEALLAPAAALPPNEVYNVAGSEGVSLGQVVQQIADFYQVPLHARHTDGEPSYLQGSNAKICRALSYTPQVSFAEGLAQVLQSQNAPVEQTPG